MLAPYKNALGVAFFATVALAGCSTTNTEMPWSKSSSSNKQESNSSSSTVSKAEGKSSPGKYCNKPIEDSTQVAGGDGCPIKGEGDWEGEISGVAASGSKFQKLKIGMPMKQVRDLVGEPSDEGAYITAKAWIPFYFGQAPLARCLAPSFPK